MHLVGIQGSDIVDGTRTLVLGLVWQLMRISITQTLATLSRGGKAVTDQDMVKWANDTVKKGGKSSTMRSFKDPSLSNAVFFLDLLNGVKPGIVDYSLVSSSNSDEDKRLNGECARRSRRRRRRRVRALGRRGEARVHGRRSYRECHAPRGGVEEACAKDDEESIEYTHKTLHWTPLTCSQARHLDRAQARRAHLPRARRHCRGPPPSPPHVCWRALGRVAREVGFVRWRHRHRCQRGGRSIPGVHSKG